MLTQESSSQPKISVVILNYQGRAWLPRCFESLETQTIIRDVEVIVADNKSSDGSDQMAEEWIARVGRGRFVQNGANLYFCEGNNRGAAAATGEYLLFLNNDAWLEPDCLERLYAGVAASGAAAAAPRVMDYEDDAFQTFGGSGFDIFGIGLSQRPTPDSVEIFAAPGCSLLISAAIFRKIGGFDPTFLMYGDESDLCWRVWIAGGRIVTIPGARVHHRGAADVNPAGETKVVEYRTSETKRYLTNRNGILGILKNSQHILLLLLVPHLLLLALEACACFALVRRWSFIRKSYLGAVADAFGMWPHVRAWRRRIKAFRARGDFGMLRFLKCEFGRWSEIRRLFRAGPPKVDAR